MEQRQIKETRMSKKGKKNKKTKIQKKNKKIKAQSRAKRTQPRAQKRTDKGRERVRRLALNPVGRAVLKRASRGGVVKELSQGTTEDQIGKLDSIQGTGELPGGDLAKAIKKKAPKEMDKGIKKLQKEGKEVTVDALCAEVKSTPGFLKMCSNVGITLEWFEDLARERMKMHEIGT